MPSQFRFIHDASLKRLRSVLPAALLAFGLLGATACGSFAATPPPPGTPAPPPPPPPPHVRVIPGDGPANVDVDTDPTGSSKYSAVVDNPPVTDDEVNVDGPHWTWGGSGSFLDDGLSASDPAHDSSATGSVTVTTQPHSPDTDNNCDYTSTFDNPGDYVLTLSATATYKETILQGPDKGKVTTVSFSGSDNPGPLDGDAPTQTSTAPAYQYGPGNPATPNSATSTSAKHIVPTSGVHLTGLSVSGATATKSMATCYVTVADIMGPPSQVSITASISPSVAASNLKSGTVTWSGGTAGSDQLTRYVSKGSAGSTDVKATCRGKSFLVRIFVVQSTPPGTGYKLTHAKANSITPQPFGETDWYAATYTADVYLSGTTWKFHVSEVHQSYDQGLNSGGDIDITGSTDSHITPTTKAAIIADLTPPPTGTPNGPPRTKYWSSSITQKHEDYHVNDFISNYLPNYMTSFVAQVEGDSVEFDCSDATTQSAASVRTKEMPYWDGWMSTQWASARSDYKPLREQRAHDFSNPLYTALINGIK